MGSPNAVISANDAGPMRSRSHDPRPTAPNRSASRLGVSVAETIRPREKASKAPTVLRACTARANRGPRTKLRASEMTTPGQNQATSARYSRNSVNITGPPSPRSKARSDGPPSGIVTVCARFRAPRPARRDPAPPTRDRDRGSGPHRATRSGISRIAVAANRWSVGSSGRRDASHGRTWRRNSKARRRGRRPGSVTLVQGAGGGTATSRRRTRASSSARRRIGSPNGTSAARAQVASASELAGWGSATAATSASSDRRCGTRSCQAWRSDSGQGMGSRMYAGFAATLASMSEVLDEDTTTSLARSPGRGPIHP